jgi:serum/glucocorticoid-regulated kinase 2
MPSIDLDPSLSPQPSPRSLPSSPRKRRSPRAVLGLSNLLLQRTSNIQLISEVPLPKPPPPASIRSSSSSTRRRRKPRGELASVTTLSFFEPDTTVHVENTPPSPVMTATQERQARAPRRQVLRVDAQDGPWTVSVAENPHHPSSYTLYVKSESVRLAITPPILPPHPVLAPCLPFRILGGLA